MSVHESQSFISFLSSVNRSKGMDAVKRTNFSIRTFFLGYGTTILTHRESLFYAGLNIITALLWLVQTHLPSYPIEPLLNNDDNDP